MSGLRGHREWQFAARLRTLGGHASVLPEDLSHAQINAELGQPSAYTGAVDAFMAWVGGRRPGIEPAAWLRPEWSRQFAPRVLYRANRSNPVFVRVHELPPSSPSFRPHPSLVKSEPAATGQGHHRGHRNMHMIRKGQLGRVKDGASSPAAEFYSLPF